MLQHAFEHLQHHLAAAESVSNWLRNLQHAFAETTATVLSGHDYVVNIQQWPTCKSAEPFQASNQARRLAIDKSKNDMRCIALLQL